MLPGRKMLNLTETILSQLQFYLKSENFRQLLIQNSRQNY